MESIVIILFIIMVSVAIGLYVSMTITPVTPVDDSTQPEMRKPVITKPVTGLLRDIIRPEMRNPVITFI